MSIRSVHPATEVHHLVPRCLLRLQERAECADLDGAGIGAWLEWEWEAGRWNVSVEIAREDLEKLIERSAVVLDQNTHRLIHESDWQRWGRRGGNATLRRYGTSWYSLLALRRWERITAEGLEGARVVSHGLPIKDDVA